MSVADPLSRLVTALESSLAMYLSASGISTYPGPEELRLAIADLASEHRSLIERAGTILQEREVFPPRTAYPLSFTACHDLDLAAMLPRLIESLRRQLPEFAAVAAAAGDDATAAELAAEARTSTQRHLDQFEQLGAKLRAGLSGKAAVAQT